jgi:hypothetical protein
LLFPSLLCMRQCPPKPGPWQGLAPAKSSQQAPVNRRCWGVLALWLWSCVHPHWLMLLPGHWFWSKILQCWVFNCWCQDYIFSLSGCYQFFASHWHYYSEILPHNQLGHSKIYILFHYAIRERREAGAVLRYDARRRKGQEICDLQIHIFHTQAGFLHLVFY